MSKPQNSPLFVLIKSLSKSEKRHFRLYANRNFGEKNVKFLELFDVIEKQDQYDPDKIRNYFAKTSISALSNLKAHLYEQLLISLRLLHHNNVPIRIQEILSFANVLYSKGLYMQSLDQLKRARVLAESIQDDLSLHMIVDLERRLELFYVTESGENRAQELVETSLLCRESLEAREDWSNVALRMYDYYLKFGHVKNEHQFQKVERFFAENTAELVDQELSILGQLYKHMAYTWFYFITLNFARCYRNAVDWISIAEANETILQSEPILYLKGMHNAMSAVFYSNKPRQFAKLFERFKAYVLKNEADFDANTRIVTEVYLNMGELNRLFLEGRFRGNEAFIDKLTSWLEQSDLYLDQNRILVLHYKIACLYFGADDFRNCIVHLNKIIHSDVKEKYLKQDVQCFARILNLVAHYELGNDDLVEYQLKSTYRFLIKYGDMQGVQKLIIHFIRNAVYARREDLKQLFISLKLDLERIFDDPFEQRALLYLDLISWLKSHIEGIPVESIIRKRQALR